MRYKKLTLRTIFVGILWTILIVFFVIFNFRNITKNMDGVIKSEARSNFNKDKAIRYWAASHGGVYVEIDSVTQPNPYLASMPERDITTPSGKKLTLMNPAYMIRQMNEYFAKYYGIKGSVTSLKPLRLENKPDEWERQALLQFEKGLEEVAEYTTIDNEPYYRIMQPMKVEKTCLKCHIGQNYKIGDVSGGFGISIDISSHLKLQKRYKTEVLISLLILWFSVMILFIIAYIVFRKQEKRTKIMQTKIIENEKRYDEVLNTFNNLVYISSKDNKIIYANNAFKNKFGKDVIENDCFNIIYNIEEECKNCWYDLLPERGERKSDNLIKIEDKSYLSQHLLLETGDKLTVFTDITEIENAKQELEKLNKFLKNAKEKAEKNEKRLKEAEKMAHLGYWDFDIQNNIFTWSDEVSIIFSLKPQETKASYEAFLDVIHPEDRKMVNTAYLSSLRNKADYEIQHRLLLKSGEVKYVLEKCSTDFSPEGNPLRSIGTVLDVTEHVKITEELKASKEKAEESDRLKSAFLANMSHEIRTPMNAIVGFSSFLKDENLPKEKLDRYSDIIISSSSHLLDLINDIIDISKIEAGQVKLNIKPVGINGIVKELYGIFKEDISNKNKDIKFNYQIPDKHIICDTDETRLRQTLLNLLSNAVKFTLIGEINFGYRIENQNLVFFVKDTGIGISEKSQKKIFKRFIQAAENTEKLYGGTGLGLAISKACVELLGGEINVKSEKNKGAEFYFTIPYKVPTVPKKEVQNKKIKSKFSNEKILIVEDDRTNYQYIEAVLINLNLDIHHALNGIEAINFVKNNDDLKLIFMDIRMPELDGYEATAIIRRTNPFLPIVAQTAYAFENDKKSAFESGCSDFISKPIKKADLLKMLNKYL